MIETTSPRIYVASLSDYNAGRLHGVWIDADQDADDIWTAINAMLAASPEFREFPQGGPAEEWAIHDHEGFGPWTVHEYESIERVATVAALIAEHGEAFAAFVENDSSVLDGDPDAAFLESYRGCYENEKDYAYETARDLGLPGVGYAEIDELENYLDWDALQDYYLDGCWTYEESYDKLHVFRSV